MTFVSPKFAGVSEDAQAFRSKWGIRGQGEMRQPVRWLVARGAGTFFSVMVGRAPGLRRVRSGTGWVWGGLGMYVGANRGKNSGGGSNQGRPPAVDPVFREDVVKDILRA